MKNKMKTNIEFKKHLYGSSSLGIMELGYDPTYRFSIYSAIDPKGDYKFLLEKDILFFIITGIRFFDKNMEFLISARNCDTRIAIQDIITKFISYGFVIDIEKNFPYYGVNKKMLSEMITYHDMMCL